MRGKRHDSGPSRPVITVANTESVHSTPSGEPTNAVQLLDPNEQYDQGDLQDEVKLLEPNEAANLERLDRPKSDSWEKRIGDWVIDRGTISATELLASCIGKPQTQWTQADKNRVARSLRALGWKRFQHRHGPWRECTSVTSTHARAPVGEEGCRARVKSGTGDKADLALTHSTGDSGRTRLCRRWINDTCLVSSASGRNLPALTRHLSA